MSRRATADTQGEVQGISAMVMGLGQLVAPLLLTGTMAWFTSDSAPVHFPGAAFLVAALFGLMAAAMLRTLPRATHGADAETPPDRQRVVSGKSVTVRGELGGGARRKKKN